MQNEIIKDWMTLAGLRAVIIRTPPSLRRTGHYCGYVGVQSTSAFYGKSYSEQLPYIKREQVDSAQLGKKSPILLFTASCGSDEEGAIRRSLDIAIDVHGGITFSEGHRDYPIKSDLWWFGFDCAHCDDNFEDGGQPLEYVICECESMARQLINLELKQ